MAAWVVDAPIIKGMPDLTIPVDDRRLLIALYVDGFSTFLRSGCEALECCSILWRCMSICNIPTLNSTFFRFRIHLP